MQPRYQDGVLLVQILGNLGDFKLPFLLVFLILAGAFLYLLLRPRPLSNYLAFIGATLYPSAIGFLAASWAAIHMCNFVFGQPGFVGPGPMPTFSEKLALGIGEILCRLVTGGLLTCVFLPLGVGLLLFRNPKWGDSGHAEPSRANRR